MCFLKGFWDKIFLFEPLSIFIKQNLGQGFLHRRQIYAANIFWLERQEVFMSHFRYKIELICFISLRPSGFASWRARRALKALRVLENKSALLPWPSVRNCAIRQLLSVKRLRIVSFLVASHRDAAVPGSNRTQRLHLCAGTRFSAPRLLWVHKEQRLAEQLVQSEPGTPGGEIQQPPDAKSPRLRIFTPSSTLSHRRHRRLRVSICFNAFKRGRMATERVKPLSLWLPERGCFCRKWRHRPLVSAWPRRGEEYFRRVVAASKRRVFLHNEEIRHRGVLASIVGG